MTAPVCQICDKPIGPNDACRLHVVGSDVLTALHTECEQLSIQTASMLTAEWYLKELRAGRPRRPGEHILHLVDIYGPEGE